MATEVLAIGTTAANSSDVVVVAGTPLTVCLKDAAGTDFSGVEQVDILLKDDAGQYFTVDRLTAKKPALMIVAAGTYRFSRQASGSCGVFSA